MSETATLVVSAANVRTCLTLYMSPPFAWHALSTPRIAFLRRHLHLHGTVAQVDADRGQERRQRRKDVREGLDVMTVVGRDQDRLIRERRQPARLHAVDYELVPLLLPRQDTAIGRCAASAVGAVGSCVDAAAVLVEFEPEPAAATGLAGDVAGELDLVSGVAAGRRRGCGRSRAGRREGHYNRAGDGEYYEARQYAAVDPSERHHVLLLPVLALVIDEPYGCPLQKRSKPLRLP